MIKINKLFSCTDKTKKKINQINENNSKLLCNYEVLNKVNLQDCRKVEEEFFKEFKILEEHLKNPDFGVGTKTIGCELELTLINKFNLLPSMINLDLCEAINSNSYQPEISKFCIEFNGPVISAKNQPLFNLAHELELGLHNLNEVALNNFSTKAVPIGIIPTLTTTDLGMDALTPYWRYYTIDKLLRSMRCNRDFVINIDGDDPLHVKWYNTILEGVNSSYQVHLRVNPNEFSDYYNAAQLAAAFVLSISCNSPLLFGHRLWEETRIAVFEQTVNNHNIHPSFWQEQQRVSFGRGWIKDGALGLLKEVCELYYPIFPLLSDPTTPKINQSQHNNGPKLMHIARHNSTVWPWNRAIYDSSDNGHFRIEMRYLPSGPTVYDMVMNTGFMLGLTTALSKNINEIISELPFKYAQYNFYQAAQNGLAAKFILPCTKSKALKEINVTDILDEMISLASQGLADFGASDIEIKNMQTCIKARLNNKLTGSIWQKTVYNKLLNKHKFTSNLALKNMFKLYIENQSTNLPVANWSIDV